MPSTRLTGGRQPQVKSADARTFDADKQARFFAELAATCNVTLSARRAKVSPPPSIATG